MMKNKMYDMPEECFSGFCRKGSWAFMLLILIFLSFISVVSCDNYDDFTTDRSQTLAFDHDSICFDTLIATVPSATKTLIVHNYGEQGIRIAEIRLEGGAASPFRINVDGQDLSRTGTNRATDFEVRRRDSIFVRCEVTVPEQKVDTAVALEDAIIFTLESGISQRVVLTAGGQNAWFMRGRTLSADTTLTAGRPIVVYDSLVVAPEATLTLAPGTQLLFHNKAGLIVYGRLVAEGTLEQPVTLRGDRTDHIFDYLKYDRLPGLWEGISIGPNSADNRLTYVDLHSATYGIVCDSTATDTAAVPTLSLLNCRIHNIGGDGLRLGSCRAEVRNTEVSNTQGRCVAVTGGIADFTHCTLAQFYPLTFAHEALFLTNRKDSVTYRPLHRFTCTNSVITGYEEDVLIGDWMPNSDYRAEYYFRNCLIATVETTDPLRFVEIVYDKRPDSSPFNTAPDSTDFSSWHNFKLFDSYHFEYDFTPVEQSKIRNIADPNYCQDLPLDRLGRRRFADGAPDAGCYEFIKEDAKAGK